MSAMSFSLDLQQKSIRKYSLNLEAKLRWVPVIVFNNYFQPEFIQNASQ